MRRTSRSPATTRKLRRPTPNSTSSSATAKERRVSLPSLRPPADLNDAARAIADMPEDTLEEIGVKRSAFERLHSGQNWLNMKIASDCYIAAFFAAKDRRMRPDPSDWLDPTIPLTDHVWAAARGQTIYGPLVGVADQHRTRGRGLSLAYRVSAHICSRRL